MVWKLMKELPLMFVVAAVIWLVVAGLFLRNAKNKGSFFTRHRSTFLGIVIAVVLTLADIWLFVQYIPTHFKKAPTEQVAAPVLEPIPETESGDSIAKKSTTLPLKDSSKKEKDTPVQPVAKTYATQKASIRFLSNGSTEDIEATNHSVACSLNDKTGKLRILGLIKGFQFENELMQDHFNDKEYMDSETYPTTSFSGKITDMASLDLSKDGTYPITAEGELTIHGVTKPIIVKGTITVTSGKIQLQSVFKIKRMDFGINTDEVAETLEITVKANFG
ncbi:MAG: YceI family protein [Bacteroidota bacterium]|nr:YceI family protein [Bacteroidota bacterium]